MQAAWIFSFIIKLNRSNMDYFTKEADFENAVIALLQNYGWEQKVLKNYT